MRTAIGNSLSFGIGRLSLGVALFLLVSLLPGCSRISPEKVLTGGKSLVGNYVRAGHPRDYIDFKADHTLYVTEGGQATTGTYEVDGDVVTLKFANGRAGRVRIKGNILVEEDDGSLWVRKQPAGPGVGGDISGNQSSAMGTLRTLNTAEITYASTYNRGYSATLSFLGPPPTGTNPIPTASGLVDNVLAGRGNTAVKSGYRFVYSPGPPVGRRIDTYAVYADPVEPGISGQVHYYTDQSGIIRMNRERRAGPHDPPLAG